MIAMSVVAARELEEDARKYAGEAIRLDSQGAHGMAIQNYQKAISTLIKLVQPLSGLQAQQALHGQGRALPGEGQGHPAGSRSVPRDIQQEECDLHARWPVERQRDAGRPRRGERPRRRRGTGTEAAKGPQMVQQLKSSFNELVVKEKPNVKWDDVIGLDDAKRAIRESIVFPFERPDLFPLGWPRGMLLYGPPGCGKTILAAATAAEINGYFISIDAASIMSKWLGEAEKNVSKLFTEARKLLEKGDPVIIFIDELDSMLGSRTNEVGGEIRVRNQFLKEMDGIQDKGKHTHLYTIGATNKPWALDWPFLRRFEKRIYVPLPNFEGRISMFKNYTAPINVDQTISLEDLSRISEGYSGSDITGHLPGRAAPGRPGALRERARRSTRPSSPGP